MFNFKTILIENLLKEVLTKSHITHNPIITLVPSPALPTAQKRETLKNSVLLIDLLKRILAFLPRFDKKSGFTYNFEIICICKKKLVWDKK